MRSVAQVCADARAPGSDVCHEKGGRGVTDVTGAARAAPARIARMERIVDKFVVVACCAGALALTGTGADVVAALLVEFQTPDGIRIPEVLVPYTGFDMIR